MDPPQDPRTTAKDFHDYLDSLDSATRLEFINAAREIASWPSRAYVASHASKWGRGRTPDQYHQWTQMLKYRAGVEVYAFVHPIHRSRSIAFVDHAEGAVVSVDLDERKNRDTYSPARPTRLWVADQIERGLYHRLRDTER